jgi:hypothetical protein
MSLSLEISFFLRGTMIERLLYVFLFLPSDRTLVRALRHNNDSPLSRHMRIPVYFKHFLFIKYAFKRAKKQDMIKIYNT